MVDKAFSIAGQSTYSGDEAQIQGKNPMPVPSPVPFGTKVEGVLFDGYPQIVKQEINSPSYKVKKEKDIMVSVRDGTRLAIDVYRPETEQEKFPALLAWGIWGKDLQEAVDWLADAPQPYYHSALWDGTMEAGNFNYTVPRGYVHVIAEPRGFGNSEGFGTDPTWDIYDIVEWIAAQPWCNGKVGMIGPSSYSISQMKVGVQKPPHLVALRPDENPCGSGDHFTGIYDTLVYHIVVGRHGNDSSWVFPNKPFTMPMPMAMNLPDIKERVEEALNHPDIKYNSKMYSHLKYPAKNKPLFDSLINHFRPDKWAFYDDLEHSTGTPNQHVIDMPIYQGTPWMTRFYAFTTFETWRNVSTPTPNKKLIVYPPGFPHRPCIEYHDETVRWYDYWLKGIDNGIMDEPPIKMFIMGINKWRFEHEWPLKRTQWTKFYLQPGGGLAQTAPAQAESESFTQPAANLDPTVYCLRYTSEPMSQDMEVTGPVAIHLQAAIDIDDTNWMVDLVDIAPDGFRQTISIGHLKAAQRALDKEKSLPYLPIHPKQLPVPVPPGEVLDYHISMLPTANVFKKGHKMEIIIRNQDDLLSRLGTWGVYMLPFMRTVKHDIHFGVSHVLLPLVPAN